MRSTVFGIRFPAAGAALALALAACDGPNQFSGGLADPIGSAGGPRVEIEVPRGDSLSAKPVGDSVMVRVRVRSGVGIDGVRFEGFALRGDPSLGTQASVERFEPKDVVLGSARDTVLTRYLVATEEEAPETALIAVTATDSDGAVQSDTVSLILGGPDVQLLNLEPGQPIQAGLGLNLSATAQDPQGVLELTFELEGALDTTLVRTFGSAVDSIRVDTTVAIPVGLSGALNVSVRARNSVDIIGGDGPVAANVVTGGAGDSEPPSARLEVSALPKLELTDSIQIQVLGNDDAQGSGIIQAGYTVLAISQARQDTLVRSGSATFTPARTGTVAAQFSVPVFNVDSLSLPDTLQYEVTGYLLDQAGNCSAAVSDELQQLECGNRGGAIIAEGRLGQRLNRAHVSGRTVQLPSGGLIMDAAVDTARRNLFLSNLTRNRVELFRLDSESFGPPVGVGSEPWGLAFSRDGDSLWVANSGGTNLSVIDLEQEREVESNRFLTPDVVIFDIELNAGETATTYKIYPLPTGANPSFSDRPQFAAVDSFGSVIYSTKTTLIGDIGTARKAFFEDGSDRSEVKLFVEHALTTPADDFWAVAHIDSIGTSLVETQIGSITITTAALTLYDHVPGFPSQVIVGRANTGNGELPTDAWAELVSKGSDAYMVEGARWDVPSLGFRDTTYVAGSGDGGWVAVGEGAREPVARVLMYRAQPGGATGLSGFIQVADLLTNPSEQVKGLGMNYDGTLTVVRGLQAAYFISPDLRLQGLTGIPLATTGAGAALHPLHADFRTLENPDGQYRPDTHLAFVGTGERTVDIIDTFKFLRIGRVAIRDVVVGPLKAILPFPEDNAGFQCSAVDVTDQAGRFIGQAVQVYEGNDFNAPIVPNGITEDRCVVVKLFGTTSSGGVVVVDVRKADILREHPER
ncbi:MAG: hypothetical protein HKN71_03020 [Gemmatimonadetes bacterium]|nr:hypothetical protein [Gemmatimonadota bacterium]